MLGYQKTYWMYKAEMSLGFSLTKTANRSKLTEKWPTDIIFILFHRFHGIKFQEHFFFMLKKQFEDKTHETKHQIAQKLTK